MTNVPVARRWRWGARAAAVVAAGVSLAAAGAACRFSTGVWQHGSVDWVGLGVIVAMVPFMLGFVGVIGWLAWRLWFRWDATTARAALATSIAVALLWSTLDGVALVERWLGWNGRHGLVANVAVLLDLVLGAAVYRRTVPALIRSADLAERPDEYGQPPGRAGRARAFCVLLGWSVWLTASEAGHSMMSRASHGGPDLWDGTTVLGPVVLGWGTYKVVLWKLSPRTRAAVPVGGFEVLPAAETLVGMAERPQQLLPVDAPGPVRPCSWPRGTRAAS